MYLSGHRYLTRSYYSVFLRLLLLTGLMLSIGQSLPAQIIGTKNNLANKKVLILHHNNVHIPANQFIDDGLVTALVAAGIPTVSIFSEFLEERRFYTPEIQKAYLQYLQDFYAQQSIDLVIITEESTLFFLNTYGHDFLPEVPVVLCAVSEGTPIPAWLAGRVTGNLKNIDVIANIQNIQALQPNLKELSILLGTSPQDAFFENYVQDYLAAEKNLPPQIRILKDQPLADSLKQISQLESGAAVLVVSVFQDGAGQNFNPKDVVQRVVEASKVPVYGISDTYMDTGFMGGNLISFKDLGRDAADYAIKLLQGANLAEIPLQVYRNRNYYNHDALLAAGLDPGTLPAATVFYNHTPTFWEMYWREFTFVILFLAVCLGLILALSLQLGYRRKAEAALQEQTARLDRILMTNPAIIFVYNTANQHIEFYNQRFLDFFKWPDPAGRVISVGEIIPLIYPEDLKALEQSIDNLKAQLSIQGTIRELEYRLLHGDGTWHWVHCLFADHVSHHDLAQKKLLITAIDITAQKLQSEALSSALAEKKVLLRELHHRIKNNMGVIQSLLQLYLPALKDEADQTIFREMCSRIQAMALVHTKLYESENLSKIALDEYLNDLSDLFHSSYSSETRAITFYLDVAPLAFSIDRAIPIGIFLNELITNSVKYAGPGDLLISIAVQKFDEDKVELVYNDNGKGLAPDFNMERDGNMGFQTLLAIGEIQLQGRFSLLKGAGFACKLVFSSSPDMPT